MKEVEGGGSRRQKIVRGGRQRTEESGRGRTWRKTEDRGK